MIVIPAVDLRQGACVQLIGGDYDRERLRIPDPMTAVRDWEEWGFRWLHVVDLDAAMGQGDNREVVEQVIGRTSLAVQVGGGLRDTSRVRETFDHGAARVVLGTRAIEEPAWLTELAHQFPGLLVLAIDVRERSVLTRGWQQSADRSLFALLDEIAGLPLAALMVTAVHREGRLQGIDLGLVEDVVSQATVPLLAAGGISSVSDLELLADRGVAGAVVGTALYTGDIDPRTAATEYCQ